jgi:hypothetical protein
MTRWDSPPMRPPRLLPDIGGIKHDLNHPQKKVYYLEDQHKRLVVQNQSFFIHRWDKLLLGLTITRIITLW